MELLYVWIDKYRNIERQGFNFSPRYRFEYNAAAGELTVKEKSETLEGFFPEGISNVTAIVGENGAGKSNLLHFLKHNLANYGESEHSVYELDAIHGIFVYDDYIFHQQAISIHNSSEWIDRGFSIVPFGYAINDGLNHPEDDLLNVRFIYFSNIYDGNSEFGRLPNLTNISTNFLLKHDKWSDGRYTSVEYWRNREQPEAFAVHESIEHKRQIEFSLSGLRRIPFPLPEEFTVTIQSKGRNNLLDKSHDWISTNELSALLTLERSLIDGLDDQLNEEGEASNLYRFKLLFGLNLLKILAFDFPEVFSRLEESTLGEMLYGADFELAPALTDNASLLFRITAANAAMESLEVILAESDIEVIEDLFGEIDRIERTWYKFANATFKIGENGPNIFEFFKNYHVATNWKEYLAYQWRDLSSGQASMLKMLARFYSIKDDIEIQRVQHLKILIDEGDVFFHPEWQRQYLSLLLEVLPQIFEGKDIQIILTTHSPFLASDLPRDYLIFLGKDDCGKCVIADGMQEMKQTFGANIHTLLSDSFFMQNGLVGEFAKKKIDAVIKYLNGEEPDGFNSLDRAEQYVKIIGEPIIRRQLQKMIDSKRLGELREKVDRVDEIDGLKATITLLEERLVQLEGGGDD